MNKKHTMDMINGPIAKKIIIFSIPIILSGLLQLLYNAADIVVVGRFSGKESLAAVGSTSSLAHLFLNLFIGLSSGSCVTLARYIGMKDKVSSSNTVHTAITLSLISGVVVGIAGFFLSNKMLRLMNSPTDVIDKATLYLKIYFCGMPAVLSYNFGSSLLRAVGDTKRPMIILMFSGVVNVVLNLVFVIFFKMDVAGVALATIISQVISAVFVVICIITEKEYCHLDIRKLRIHKKEFMSIIKVGLPAGIQSCIFSLSNIQIQSAVNSFGSSVVAGNSAASNIEGFVYTAMNSIYQAALTFTSQNFGAGKIKRIKKVLTNCLGIVTIVGIIFSSVVVLFSSQLLGLYSSEAEIIELGQIRLKYVCSTYFLCGIMEIFTGVLRGLNYSLVPMLVSVLGVCGIRMMWVTFLFPLFNTLDSLYISYPISWFITSSVHCICLLIILKKITKNMNTNKALAAEYNDR